MEYQMQKIKEMSVDKGKRGVLRVVFSRTGILLVCLLIQLLMLFLGLRYLAQYVSVFRRISVVRIYDPDIYSEPDR